MKTRLAMKAAAGLVLGSALFGVPAASADEYTMYDSVRDLREYSMTRDMYDSMEPTAAGPQGPIRTDMMKSDDAHGAMYDSHYGSSYPWTELKRALGPVGGEGTN